MSKVKTLNKAQTLFIVDTLKYSGIRASNIVRAVLCLQERQMADVASHAGMCPDNAYKILRGARSPEKAKQKLVKALGFNPWGA